MFTRLLVENYRAVGPRPLELELAPVTVLVGENGAGKSSFLQALALTAQSALDDPNRNDLVLSGSRLDVPVDPAAGYVEQFRDVYFGRDSDKTLRVAFDWQAPDEVWGRWNPVHEYARHLRDEWTARGQTASYEWTRTGLIRPVFSHELRLGGELVFRLHGDRGGRGSEGANGSWELWDLGSRPLPGGYVPSRLLSSDLVNLLRNLHANLGLTPGSMKDNMAERVFLSSGAEFLETALDWLRDALSGVGLLSDLRGASLMHRDPGPRVSFVGKHGDTTLRLLSDIQHGGKPEFGLVKNWAKRFGLPEIHAGLDGTVLSVGYTDPLSGTSLELKHAATGTKQALTLIAQLLLSPRHSTLLVEEPENNLHPRFEKLLPEMFSDSVASGHQLLVSTHSEVLVAALASAVRAKRLRPEQVAVWHLERTGGGIDKKRLEINSSGHMSEWVSSFAAVEEEIFDEWYETLPAVREPSGAGYSRAERGGTARKGRKGR